MHLIRRFTRSSAAQRAGNNQDISILVDGQLVGTVKPTSVYSNYNINLPSLVNGSHMLTFQGLDSAGGDNTAFVTNISLTGQPSATPQNQTTGHLRNIDGSSQRPALPGGVNPGFPTKRADGLYVGFIGAGNAGNPADHVFLAVVQNGVEQIIEYGRDTFG